MSCPGCAPFVRLYHRIFGDRRAVVDAEEERRRVVAAEEERRRVVAAEEERRRVVAAEEERRSVVAAEEGRRRVVAAEEERRRVVAAEEERRRVVAAEEERRRVLAAAASDGQRPAKRVVRHRKPKVATVDPGTERTQTDDATSGTKALSNPFGNTEVIALPGIKEQPVDEAATLLPGVATGSGFDEQLRRAYWDLLRADLEKTPPEYEHAFTLVKDIKELIMDLLVLESHAQLRERIESILDLDVLQRQFETRSMDFRKLLTVIVETIVDLCAPVADELVVKLKAEQDDVELVKCIYELLENIKPAEHSEKASKQSETPSEVDLQVRALLDAPTEDELDPSKRKAATKAKSTNAPAKEPKSAPKREEAANGTPAENGTAEDPRLFALTALRRRGIPPEAINNFVAKLGLSVAQSSVDPKMLDAVVQDYLNVHAPRTMAVTEPLKVSIENFAELELPSTLVVPDFPQEPSSKTHPVAVDGAIYIESSDFREKAEKGFRRLTPEQTVGLKYLELVLRLIRSEKHSSGEIAELVVHAEKLSEQNKPEDFIHWVAKPVRCEVRLYEQLFKHENPENKEEVPGGFLTDVNANTPTVLRHALVDRSVADAKVLDQFQFERIGFFAVDPASTPEELVFNQTAALKEDAGKN